MRSHWLLRGLKFAVFALLFLALVTFGLMRLWNWLMPGVFGWHPITFWQALGLLVLSKILFGGFRGGPGRHAYWRRRMRGRWEQMSPEEREKFQGMMRGRCGHFGASAVTPKA
jgi:Ca2+/H+ antiporter, TMEM165/GDT1 family